jgi:23S rRNA pseudouridine2605 synthase
VQKFLANQGIASRREIEHWINAGEILIEGKVCVLGQRITGNEKIVIRGEPVYFDTKVRTRVLLYHKRCGEIVTHADPQQRPTIFDRLPTVKPGRWLSVGRLDLNTSGLLLLTTDGVLANYLMHPSSEIEREYRVRVHGKVSDEVLSRLQQGVQLEDGLASLTLLEIQETQGTNTWYCILLKEGRNREVRRLWESQGLQVSRLIRTRFGFIELPRGLKKGEYIELPPGKVRQLYKLIK